MPGSSVQLTGGTITNAGNVAVYAKIAFDNVTATIDADGAGSGAAQAITLADYFKAANLFEMPAGAVTGYTDMYLIPCGSTGNTVTIGAVSLTLKDVELVNGTAGSGEIQVNEGAVITISYRLHVTAVQGDNITPEQAAAKLNATAATNNSD